MHVTHLRLEDARFSLHEKDQHARELQRQVALLQPRHDGDGDERLMMLLTQEREAWKEKVRIQFNFDCFTALYML